MVGIIGAMEEEVRALREQMQDARTTEKAGLSFTCGTLAGREAAVVCAGVGKVNAAVCAQLLIDLFSVDALINTGVAGGLLPGLHIGDIVLSEDARYHDYDVSALGMEPGEMMGMATSVFPADKKLLALAKASCARLFAPGRARTGRILSGDRFIADPAVQKRLRETFGGACTEMEGAAIAHTAWLNRVPFLIVRAISDGANDGSPADFFTFKEEAIANSVHLLLDMLAHM